MPGRPAANIGKAYAGLIDVETAEMTEWFLEHMSEERVFLRIIEAEDGARGRVQ